MVGWLVYCFVACAASSIIVFVDDKNEIYEAEKSLEVDVWPACFDFDRIRENSEPTHDSEYEILSPPKSQNATINPTIFIVNS
jgi:hypothetical protein